MKRLALASRMLAWLGLAAIVILSVVPAVDRPVTGAGQDLEHLTAFGLTAAAFAYGYEQPFLRLILCVLIFCAGIELLQVLVPTRHARIDDFIVDFLASSIAVAIVVAIKRGLSIRTRE